MITIITAFFDINRGQWSNYRRSSDNYLESFSKWAHLQNNLIVYLENNELEEKILAIRDTYGLKDKTKIVIVGEIEQLEPEINKMLTTIASNEVHKIWRYKSQNPEVINAAYNYVMFLKFWCMRDAKKRFDLNEYLAWMDFGFAHNGALYPYENDFDFEWNYDFGEGVTLFNLKEIDNRPIFDIINTMDTYIMGCVFIVSSDVIDTFYKDIKSYITILGMIGYMDDDQVLLLMALRNNSDYVKAFTSSWFMPIKQYGNTEMRINRPVSVSILRRTLRIIKQWYTRHQFLEKLNNHLKNLEYK